MVAGESAREVAPRSEETAVRSARVAEVWEGGGGTAAPTATVLEALPGGWTTLSDVRWPRRSSAIGHVVVGPSGIFVVESEDWSGTVAVDQKVLREDGRCRDDAVDACADAVRAVGEFAGGLGLPVSGVLCLVRDEHLAVASRGVMVCTTRNLQQILRTCPLVLTPRQVANVVSALDDHLHAALSPPPVPAVPVTAAPVGETSDPSAQPEREPAPRRRVKKPRTKAERTARRPPFARLVVAAALLVGLGVVGPDVATKVGPAVSDEITSLMSDEGACPSIPTAAAPATTAPKAKRAEPRRTQKKARSRRAATAAGRENGAQARTQATTALTPC
jgi:Nuclease-related domain